MFDRFRTFCACFVTIVQCTTLVGCGPNMPARDELIAIVDVRVFDGTKVIDQTTVILRDAWIEALGPHLAVPDNARIIDGRGLTLLPGLIDAHTHSYGTALEDALRFGVTTELDMFTEHSYAAAKRAEQEAGVSERADLFSAGTLVTAPGGHGTQFGVEIPTLVAGGDARAFVAARVAEGSDWIKVVSEDLSYYGGACPALDQGTLAAVINAAHELDRIAVVHASEQIRARAAIEAGADGLAHVFADNVAGDGFVHLAAEREIFVIPTLVLTEASSAPGDTKHSHAVPDLAEYLSAEQRQSLAQRLPAPASAARGLERALASVAKLHAAGVPILAGSDAPNPGTAHGLSLHRELELLVSAGLTPVDALAAATSVPADVFGLKDRGRIAAGTLADLLLVAGDPTQDISATQRIEVIIRRGHQLEERRALTTSSRAATPDRTGLGPGLIGDFDSSQITAGWHPSVDNIMGGNSQVELRQQSPGSAATRGYLEIRGAVAAGAPFPWAGTIYFPAATPMAPVDASGLTELVFWARGSGALRVMVFAEYLGYMPAEQQLMLGAEWREYSLSMADFVGVDLAGLRAISFAAGPQPGPFAFDLDEIRLMRAHASTAG